MKRFLFLLLPILFLLNGCNSEKLVHDSHTKDHATNEDGSVNFIFTKNELLAVGKWKNRSMDDLSEDVDKGDPGALYEFGECLLIGHGGWTIDTEMANHFFAKSASLGFGPALDQIRRIYNEENRNPFLSYVYLNLTISAGHPEFTPFYHKFKSEVIIPKVGRAVAQEIERIAIHKQSLIRKNQEELKSNSKLNQKKPLHLIDTITDEDVLFDMDYWARVWKDKSPDNLNIWLKENWGTKIERLAIKAQQTINRLSAYDIKDN